MDGSLTFLRTFLSICWLVEWLDGLSWFSKNGSQVALSSNSPRKHNASTACLLTIKLRFMFFFILSSTFKGCSSWDWKTCRKFILIYVSKSVFECLYVCMSYSFLYSACGEIINFELSSKLRSEYQILNLALSTSNTIQRPENKETKKIDLNETFCALYLFPNPWGMSLTSRTLCFCSQRMNKQTKDFSRSLCAKK